MLHLRELLKEARLHGPILEIVRILQKDLGHFVAVVRRVVGEDVSVRVWPVKIEILDKSGRKRAGRRVLSVLEDETVTQAGPVGGVRTGVFSKDA